MSEPMYRFDANGHFWLQLTAVPYWLATIHLDEVGSPGGRMWLGHYQEECARVLRSHGLRLDHDLSLEDKRRAMSVLYDHVALSRKGGVQDLVEEIAAANLALLPGAVPADMTSMPPAPNYRPMPDAKTLRAYLRSREGRQSLKALSRKTGRPISELIISDDPEVVRLIEAMEKGGDAS